MSDGVHAKCALFGIFNDDGDLASQKVYYGLHALQHRGQESAGIVAFHEEEEAEDDFSDATSKQHSVGQHRDFGLVLEVFSSWNLLRDTLRGSHAIGHTRYSTSGKVKSLQNIQPFYVKYHLGNLALAHNGNLSNKDQLWRQFVSKGTLFQTTSDSELILHLISHSSKRDQTDQIVDALGQCEGAFSVILLTDEALFGVRDPNGFRPLVLGRLRRSRKSCAVKAEDEDELSTSFAYILASETCAFDIVGAEYVREIAPGEIIRIDRKGCHSGEFKSVFLPQRFGISPCIFEFVYFSRPDSILFGEQVQTVRKALGSQLAEEIPPTVFKGYNPVEDKVVVIAVPDTANFAALGYANELRDKGFDCSYEIGLIRNHYVGRTFISPGQDAREIKVRSKFNTVRRLLEGNVVVLVDDSVVRGTTSKFLIQMVRDAGAKSVHFMSASPAVISPCFYGMDFPSKEELVANQFESVESIAKYLGADSLHYLSLDGLQKAVLNSDTKYPSFCMACFTGEYPVPFESAKKIEW